MRYSAFLSYSRADERCASWLHRKLDRYRPPRTLGSLNENGKLIPPALHPVFRDRSDLSGGGSLPAKIEAALKDSECLIVLCSPSAAQSYWVDQEVQTFARLNPAGQIIALHSLCNAGLSEALR